MRARPHRDRPGTMIMAALAAAWPVAASADAAALDAEQVTRIVAQAAAEAQRQGIAAHVAVTDRQGRLLASFRMAGASPTTRVPGTPGEGLLGRDVPASLAAWSKAATGALLSTSGHAFSSRTASFIVQEHFPPAIALTPAGPLLGVQFSSLPCKPGRAPVSPLGLSGDPGGFPLYVAGEVVGGVGVEADGAYGVDVDPSSPGQPGDAVAEEQAALAGTRGFEPPASTSADHIFADGIRLPWSDVDEPSSSGGAAAGTFDVSPTAALPSRLRPATRAGVAGQADPDLPVRAGTVLTGADVERILDQAAAQTVRTRGAIRQPLGSHARVSVAVVDVDGRVLGFFQNDDAPGFGVDVSVQKARTAAFFSGPGAGDALARAGLGRYAQGVPLDGSVAYSTRAVGVLAQPLFPSGIDGTDPGPFSLPLPRWSPFNTGLQLDLVKDALGELLAGRAVAHCAAAPGRAPIDALPNGITVFPGGLPLFKSGVFAGAIGISGDGVDQDDLIAAAGAAGFETPPERRSDRIELRGVRLPWVKFPRHPEL